MSNSCIPLFYFLLPAFFFLLPATAMVGRGNCHGWWCRLPRLAALTPMVGCTDCHGWWRRESVFGAYRSAYAIEKSK